MDIYIYAIMYCIPSRFSRSIPLAIEEFRKWNNQGFTSVNHHIHKSFKQLQSLRLLKGNPLLGEISLPSCLELVVFASSPWRWYGSAISDQLINM